MSRRQKYHLCRGPNIIKSKFFWQERTASLAVLHKTHLFHGVIHAIKYEMQELISNSRSDQKTPQLDRSGYLAFHVNGRTDSEECEGCDIPVRSQISFTIVVREFGIPGQNRVCYVGPL